MVQSPKDTLILACLAALLSSASMVAGGEGPQTDRVLQPQSLNHAGVYALRGIEPGLTGSGVRFALVCRSITYTDGEPQNDYRPNVQHRCFGSQRFIFHDLGQVPAGISLHATAICSILFGQDTDVFDPDLGKFYYQGVVPGAKAAVYEFWYFLINNVFSHLPPDADIVSASIGSQFEDWWTRGIEALAEHYGLIVVAGIGNGSNACDPPLYPGGGANVIGVGVIDSVNTENQATNLAYFSLAYPEHSSCGPTADGRCKPDIVAPGNCLAASANAPDLYELTGNWSSFSTPIAAGAIGLLVQKAKEQPSLSLAVSPDGGNCVMRAILMNSATKLPYWHKGRLASDDDHVVPLDYIQGAGMLNAVGAYQHLVAGRNKPGKALPTGWDLNRLSPLLLSQESRGAANVYEFTVAEPTDKFITATLVWNRHYNSVYPFEPDTARDSNLRLEVWAIDPENSSNSRLLDYSDSAVDNVEHIYCRALAGYTNYEIVISYSSLDNRLDTDAAQRYGLAWTVGQSPDSDSIFWHDLNADGVVNGLDFAILLDNWIAGVKSPGSYLLGDINTDGVIDADDLQILVDHNNRQADWHTKQDSETKQ